MSALDLNCDLGEWEHPSRTAALMRQITSANIACGGHAGTPASMERCILAGIRHGVHLGAHPGLADAHQGRLQTGITPRQLRDLLDSQIGELAARIENLGATLHHIKLHGALYHRANASSPLARAYVDWVREHASGAIIFAPPGGRITRYAARVGVPVWAEGYADRGYTRAGGLVPRGEPGALLIDAGAIRQRVRLLLAQGIVGTVDGGFLPIDIRTLCVHSDTLGATKIARLVRSELDISRGRDPRHCSGGL